MKLPLSVSTISIAYIEHEDRLAIVVTSQDGERLALMLTRRLAGGLINALAGLLERTSVIGQDVPVETRDAVVLFEHQGALTKTNDANHEPGEPSSETKDDRISMQLITDVSITTHPSHFVVILRHTNQVIANFNCGRDDLHRLVAMIRSKCEHADWNLAINVNWLQPNADGSMTIN